jgi:hypothetical protein
MADVQIALRTNIYIYICVCVCVCVFLLSSITMMSLQCKSKKALRNLIWTIHYRSVTFIITGQVMRAKKEKNKKESVKLTKMNHQIQ